MNAAPPKADEGGMTRFLIFPALFPALALVMFTAPDGFRNLPNWIVEAYAIALVPALLLAWVDQALSARFPIVGPAVVAALAAILIVRFLSGGSDELWPVLMVALVAAVPAAVCSWLSGRAMRPTETKSVRQG
jgi:hypothetical protein